MIVKKSILRFFFNYFTISCSFKGIWQLQKHNAKVLMKVVLESMENIYRNMALFLHIFVFISPLIERMNGLSAIFKLFMLASDWKYSITFDLTFQNILNYHSLNQSQIL